jgi:hypothetical protein
MLSTVIRRHAALTLALLATVAPPEMPSLCAESPGTSRPATHDVQLDSQGQMTGMVVDAAGRPQADEPVAIQRVDRTADPVHIKTESDGRFRIGPLSAGTYRLTTDEGVCLCRLWTHTAAPPAASPALLIVNDATVTRGQRPIRDMFRSDPILMATVVAAAIAIPIAVHKSRDNDADGS